MLISNLDFVLDALGGDTLQRSIQTVKAGVKLYRFHLVPYSRRDKRAGKG
jgi:NADPH:quinone reductase-like Zn-dependent oxidoreductase